VSLEIFATSHRELTTDELAGVRNLFDAEYLVDFGPWNPEQPYGYAPHDVHLIARLEGAPVGHIGWAGRTIGVGDHDVVIAGVGGVLVADRVRGLGVGERLMRRAIESMREAGGIDFGYLGCREAVVPFYESCGWSRVTAAERTLDRAGTASVQPAGQPLLIFPVGGMGVWPEGDIDLRGRAW
jgi:aminoglycoside 2'-N-acetyltransferase I